MERTGKRQGVFAPGTLVEVERSRRHMPVRRVRDDEWGLTTQTRLVPGNTIWQAGVIAHDSEASSVLIHPNGVQDSDKALICTNRAPCVQSFQGPLIVEVKEGFPASDPVYHKLRLDLHPIRPAHLPDRREDKRFEYANSTFVNTDPDYIFSDIVTGYQWFRGREGLVFNIAVSTLVGGCTLDYVVSAGLCSVASGAPLLDVIGSGTIAATGDYMFHWEGRADIISVSVEKTAGTSADFAAMLAFRDIY